MWMRPEDTLPTGYDPTARPWYKSAESAGKVVYTDPYFDSSTGKLVTTIACPVVVNKETIGVVSVDVDFSEIDKSFSAWTRYDKNGTRLSFIVDSTNAITSAYPEMKALNRAQLSSGPLLEAMKPETDESMMTMNVNLAEIAKPSTDPEAEPSSSPIQGDYGRCIVTVERISDMELKLVTITKDPSLFEMFGKFQ